MDKFVEFVIGDGPNNRYALICSQCHSHNGMALQEDYEYMTFRFKPHDIKYKAHDIKYKPRDIQF